MTPLWRVRWKWAREKWLGGRKRQKSNTREEKRKGRTKKGEKQIGKTREIREVRKKERRV